MFTNHRIPTRLLAILTLLAISIPAWSASPSLGVINPRGVQRGVESELNFSGGRLADAQEILFYSPGFEVLTLEAAAGNVKVTLRVLDTCRLGQHVAQVRTASGVSEYRTFYVGPYASTAEVEPNSDFKQPQQVELNVTVTGVVISLDGTRAIRATAAGDLWSAEALGVKVGDRLLAEGASDILADVNRALAHGGDEPSR